jgi:hypothetical protein
MQLRAAHLLRVLDSRDWSLFPLGLHFLLSLKQSVVSRSRVVRMIAARGIRSLTDIEIVTRLAEGQSVIPALAFLAKSALLVKLWHRACVEGIKGLLLKFSSRADVRGFFGSFIRRLFVFVAISAARVKYRGRALLVCESLASFLSAKLLWLQQSVLPGAASIATTRSFPAYFKSFFPTTAQVDDSLVHEFEAFSIGSLHLKTFPFDVVKGTLVAPPLIDSGHRSLPRIERCLQSQTRVTVRRGAKKSEPLIRKPAAMKPRPLASTVCVPRIHRR